MLSKVRDGLLSASVFKAVSRLLNPNGVPNLRCNRIGACQWRILSGYWLPATRWPRHVGQHGNL